jgi:hypothetical protein
MPDFSKQPRDPSPTKPRISGAVDLQEGSPTKRTTQKQGAKARVRERMMGKANGNKKAGLSTSNVKSRLKEVAPIGSRAPGCISTGMFCGVPSSITMPGMGQGKGEATGPEEQQQQEDAVQAELEASVAMQTSEEMRELKLATEKWLSPTSTTPRAGSTRTSQPRGLSDPPSSAQKAEEEEARRRGEEDGRAEGDKRKESERLNEAIKMAYDLQRMAEDELSFHGSIHSKERLQTGYGW